MKMPVSYRIGFLAAAALALWVQAAPAQVIRLQKEITVEAHGDVRLGDLATITGADRQVVAEELANTVILTSVDSTRSVKAESVLLALMSQRGVAGGGGAAMVKQFINGAGRRSAW